MVTPLHLALEIDGAGAHPAAWRRAAHTPVRLLTPSRLRPLGRAAENAGFTLVTLADDLTPPDAGPIGRIGAMERAAFIAASTTPLGIAPTVSTSYAEPFHTSSQLASLDHIAVGRAGWVVGVSSSPDTARAWGRRALPDAEAHRREARDSVRAVRELWDSWEDDAVIRDVATSRYLDRDRLHYIDFTGETFAVKGPAIVPRPPQGQVLVIAPDGEADVALVAGSAPRRTASPLTFAEVEIALDTPEAPADDRIADLGTWPERGRLRYTGAADGLVRLLSDLAGVVDGARLHPLVLDEDLGVLSPDPASYTRVAQTAERGLFDAFFLGEGLRLREVDGRIHDLDIAGRPDAITQLAALAAQTRRIGLVSTSNTTFNEPADLARRLSGLDLLSEGRAGWNVVTTDNAWTGANFRRGGYLDHADRYRRAEDFLSTARAIWDGWDDDAIATSADAPAWSHPVDRIRRRGPHVDVDLTPTLPRSTQGHPVIFQAGDSAEGRDFAARNADGPLPAEDPVIEENTGAFGARRVKDPFADVARWRAAAAANGWSLRETVIALGPQRGHQGTPAGLAEKFPRFARNGAIHGFNITPYLIPDGLDDIVELLVPELQERGGYRTAYTGTTLREHLGLREPLTRREPRAARAAS
jgi:alkanesulfonate monooxygenase SsuD/methylene tetrahydromethanopterin reductase-like flavin-dependent oxidoreductase (luciferase family)